MCILIVSSSMHTRSHLERVFHRMGASYGCVSGLGECRSALRDRHFDVVVCEDELPDGNWIDVLSLLTGEGTPNLIVTGRLADNRLWADVLHRGGYDVLAQPLNDFEVERVATSAYEHYRRRNAAITKSKVPKQNSLSTLTGSSMGAARGSLGETLSATSDSRGIASKTARSIARAPGIRRLKLD